MPAARNHYQILNVAPDAEAVVIEAAYRALMKKYHPDQALAGPPGGPSAAEINHAFATLRDPERRSEYDRREWVRSQEIMLAPYAPPPAQRVSRLFGWGGWITAMVLGGLLTMIAGRANEAAVARANAQRAAAGSEPELSSQPNLPDEPVDVAPAPAAVPDLPAELLIPAPPPRAQAAPRRKVSEPRAQRPRREAPRPRTAAERDFLERQGYIY
ncbi:MAG TPA: J domain-containing protein [Allosphingosinicella sp.]|jgi:curved DNA-binding protein CbpA